VAAILLGGLTPVNRKPPKYLPEPTGDYPTDCRWRHKTGCADRTGARLSLNGGATGLCRFELEPAATNSPSRSKVPVEPRVTARPIPAARGMLQPAGENVVVRELEATLQQFGEFLLKGRLVKEKAARTASAGCGGS
jgi:hypothetical protein